MRYTMTAATVVLLAALASRALVRAAEKPWIEVRSPNFLVIANTGGGGAGDLAWQFEQVRVAFQLLWPWARRESGRPFVVFALRNDNDLRTLAPEFWEKGRDGASAVAVRGRDKDYFALVAGLAPADDRGTNPYFYAYWGYANQMLETNYPGRLPPWYQRGLNDFFANTLVQAKRVQIGRIIDYHVRRIVEGQRLSLPEILGADWQSRWVTDNEQRRSFDAHAWMLVHYLTLGENRIWLPRFNQFSALLKQGVPASAAFVQAMGDVAAVDRGFNNYIGRSLYTYVAFNTDANVKPSGFPVRTLSPSESLACRAGFHVAMNRPSEARALLVDARKAEPPSIVADEVEALLLDNENKDKEALELYTRAAKGGSSNFYVYYRRGSLLWQPGSSKEIVAEAAAAYREAVRLNPDNAWAQTSLARALAEVEPGEAAIAAARKATALEPGVVAHRLALTNALFSAGKTEDARREAERSLALATDAESRADAQRWIDHIARGATGANAGGTSSASSVTLVEGSPEWIAAATKACDHGVANACGALGSTYLAGQGVPKDVDGALGLFEKACDLSDLGVCSYVAYLKFHGAQGVPRDVAGAARLATKACDGGEADACRILKSLPK